MKFGDHLLEKQFSQVVIGAILLLAVALNFYHLYRLSGQLGERDEALASSTLALTNLNQALSLTQAEKDQLSGSLADEKERNDAFANQVEDITDTVDLLQKIKNTDPELLKKYSRVYFLNENYVPAKLSYIAKQYWASADKPEFFLGGAVKHLDDLLSSAQEDSVALRVASAYRSFDQQAALKTGYKVTYGSGANAFSADQGYSEHQLGTAVDVISPNQPTLDTTFEKTDAYKWLTQNAYKFGFILSYPKGNSYYQFEPWHWRFVGLRLARYLHREQKNFYDLDQREIDTYRAYFFD